MFKDLSNTTLARMNKELLLAEVPGLLERARARLSPQDYAFVEQIARMEQALQELGLLGRSDQEIEAILEQCQRQSRSARRPESARQPPQPPPRSAA